MAALLPADTAAVVRIRSVDDLAHAAAEVLDALDADPVDAPRTLLHLLDWPGWRAVDTSRPLAVALRPYRLGGPGPVYLVPLRRAAEGAWRSTPRHAIHASGGYLGISADREYEPGGGPTALLEGELGTPVELRGDLGDWLGPSRAVVAGALTLLRSADAAGGSSLVDEAVAVHEMVDMVYDGLEGVQDFVLRADLVDGRVVLDARVEVGADSPLTDVGPARCGPLDDLVATLDPDAVSHWVLALDAPSYARFERRRVLMSERVLSDVDEDRVLESLAVLQLLAARCGHVTAGQMSFEDGQLVGRQVTDAEDPNALADLFGRYVGATMDAAGQAVTREDATEDGWDRVHLRADLSGMLDRVGAGQPPEVEEAVGEWFRAFYGDDLAMDVVFAASEGRVRTSLGGDGGPPPDGASSGGPPADVLAALRELDGLALRFVFRADYARFLTEMFRSMSRVEVMAELGERLDGLGDVSVPVLVSGGGGGRSWRLGLDVDVAGMIRFFHRLVGR